MTDYRAPQLTGRRMVLAARVQPEIHRVAYEKATHLGLSMSEYVGALIARDNGLPSRLDDQRQSALPLDNQEDTASSA